MRIVVDARFIGKSGIGTYIENVVYHLLNEHSEHSYLFIVEKEGVFQEKENVKVMLCDIPPFSIKEMFFFPVKEINTYDVFYTPYINIPLGIRIPVFSTIHDVLFLDVDGLVSRLGKIVRKAFLWMAAKRSEVIYTVSNFSKSRIEYYFGQNKNVVVTYCGLPQKIKNFSNTDVPKKDYFIFVGNVKTHKGLKVLVEAFGKAKAEGLNSTLYIVGDNKNFRTQDSSFNESISSAKNIEFTGFVSNERLLELVKGAKALVLPSFYEGFGLPPLEALYLGTNAIISDIEVFREIYKKLPVQMFEAGNVEQLKMCLLTARSDFNNVDNVRRIIDCQYDFARTTDIIIENLARIG